MEKAVLTKNYVRLVKEINKYDNIRDQENFGLNRRNRANFFDGGIAIALYSCYTSRLIESPLDSSGSNGKIFLCIGPPELCKINTCLSIPDAHAERRESCNMGIP